MRSRPTAPDTSYSPDASAELTLHDQRFAVAALGGSTVVVRSPTPVPPGRGTIRMIVDGEVTVYAVELPFGVDPGRQAQTFRLADAVATA